MIYKVEIIPPYDESIKVIWWRKGEQGVLSMLTFNVVSHNILAEKLIKYVKNQWTVGWIGN